MTFLSQWQKSHSITLGIYVYAGKNFESYSVLGISHLLEHMVFRGGNGVTQKELYDEMNQMATRFFGRTLSDYICWGIECNEKNYQRSLRLFLKMLMIETWPSEIIEKEKEVIRRQIDRKRRDEIVYFGDYVRNYLYEPKRNKMPIMGTYETLEAITKEQLTLWRKRIFCKDAMCAVLTGDFSERDLEITKKYLQDVKLNYQLPLKSKEIYPRRFQNRNKMDIQIMKATSEYSDVSMLIDVDMKLFQRSEILLLCREIGLKEGSYLWRMVPEAEELEGHWHSHKKYAVFQIDFTVKKTKITETIGNMIKALEKIKLERKEIERWSQFSYYKRYAENCSEIKNWEVAENRFLYRDNNVENKTPYDMINQLFRKENLSIYIAGNYTKTQRKNIQDIVYQDWMRL